MLVGDHLLMGHFGPYEIIYLNVYVVIVVATVLLIKDFGLESSICMFNDW